MVRNGIGIDYHHAREKETAVLAKAGTHATDNTELGGASPVRPRGRVDHEEPVTRSLIPSDPLMETAADTDQPNVDCHAQVIGFSKRASNP